MRKLVAVFLTLIFLFSGCKSQNVRLPESTKLTEDADTEQLVEVQEETETDQSDETISAPVTQDEDPTEMEISKITDSPSSSQPSTKSIPVETDPPVTEKQTEAKPPEKKRPVETEPAVTVPEKEQETVPPVETPQETEAPVPETKPVAETQPEPESEPEPEQVFDINTWISFAKGYAQSVGLVLNPEAVDCWDNPTDANARSIYLERDLSGRLNRYAKDKDITDVWIWYEDLGGGEYLIYIGYA